MSTLGQAVNSKQLRKILEHVFSRNNTHQSTGQRVTPILIWGTHGLGKTQSVMDYALEKSWKQSGNEPIVFQDGGKGYRAFLEDGVIRMGISC